MPHCTLADWPHRMGSLICRLLRRRCAQQNKHVHHPPANIASVRCSTGTQAHERLLCCHNNKQKEAFNRINVMRPSTASHNNTQRRAPLPEAIAMLHRTIDVSNLHSRRAVRNLNKKSKHLVSSFSIVVTIVYII